MPPTMRGGRRGSAPAVLEGMSTRLCLVDRLGLRFGRSMLLPRRRSSLPDSDAEETKSDTGDVERSLQAGDEIWRRSFTDGGSTWSLGDSASFELPAAFGTPWQRPRIERNSLFFEKREAAVNRMRVLTAESLSHLVNPTEELEGCSSSSSSTCLEVAPRIDHRQPWDEGSSWESLPWHRKPSVLTWLLALTPSSAVAARWNKHNASEELDCCKSVAASSNARSVVETSNTCRGHHPYEEALGANRRLVKKSKSFPLDALLGEPTTASPSPYTPSPRTSPRFDDREGAVVIFDWDDTLFPTWFISEAALPFEPKDASESADIGESFLESTGTKEVLTKHARIVLTALQTAAQIAAVGIVTLSKRPWVTSSAKRYLPGLDFESVCRDLQIPIFYARENMTSSVVNMVRCEEGVDLFRVLKCSAIEKCIRKLYARNQNSCWKNVISIGDSEVERDALKQVLWGYLPPGDREPPLCKTVKLMDEPSVEQLSGELQLITMWIHAMLRYEEDFDINLDDCDTPNLAFMPKTPREEGGA